MKYPPGSDIAELLTDNHTQEQVYATLIKEGWKVEDIQEVLAHKKLVAKKEVSHVDLQNRVVRIITILGTLMVAAGLFLFVAAGWDSISFPEKLLLFILLMLACHIGGIVAQQRSRPLPGLARALHFLGSASFGATLMLVANTYSRGISWVDAFALWMLGVLLLGYVLNDWPQYVLATVVAVCLMYGYIIAISDPTYGSLHALTLPGVALVTVVSAAMGWHLRRRELAQSRELY
jgi:uncharacterized membrane protein